MTRALFFLPFLLACSPKTSSPDDTDTDVGDDDDDDLLPTKALSGELTWNLAFNDGVGDCTATLAYDAVEDRSQRWLCPDCEVQYLADVSFVEGDAACLSQVEGLPDIVEWVGHGQGSWFSHGAVNQQLVPLGDVDEDDETLTVSGSGSWSDVLDIEVGGTLDMLRVDDDFMHGMSPPDTYTCGWPKADPVEYEGPWEVSDQLVDGWFHDQCGEAVRLHDFLDGSYVVVDFSAVYCEPCQRMATDEPAFEEDMAKKGIDVHVFTLLVTNVSKQTETPPQDTLQAWATDFGLNTPVLADRGWGFWALGYPKYLSEGGVPGEFKGLGLPAWFVVSPDGEVVSTSIHQGYSSWASVAWEIEQHMAAK
ncbi:MAG: redoxin domain-containing protein [Proteobacteria bacterium]|jgi:thiol-disulfide isomerase/thioredoxin|nr:redoxin domain-containing protein [Pseudomonadota bacterium]